MDDKTKSRSGDANIDGKEIATPAADAISDLEPKNNKKTIIVISILIGLIFLGGGGWLIASNYSKSPEPVASKTPAPSPTPTPTPTPTTIPAPLTGLLVAPELASKPITAVVVENHPDARPQSGLSSAGVVYETLAEGGITRFLALYGDQEAPKIGPVRSLRAYFVDWALEYNAAIAHAGGNVDALDLVRTLGVKDLDGLNIGAPTFYRTRDRSAPHNLYSSTQLLDSIQAKYGFKSNPFTPTPRKLEAAGNATNPQIHIEFSYAGYQVDYQYDAKTNDYTRSMAGAPHIDISTGNQIRVKNVVVQYTPTSYGYTRIGQQAVFMKTIGSGKTIVFRDGTAVVGTWQKTARTNRSELIDATGQPIPLNPGNTWYAVLPTDKIVSY